MAKAKNQNKASRNDVDKDFLEIMKFFPKADPKELKKGYQRWRERYPKELVTTYINLRKQACDKHESTRLNVVPTNSGVYAHFLNVEPADLSTGFGYNSALAN